MPTLTRPTFRPEAVAARSSVIAKPLPQLRLFTPPHDPELFDAETWFAAKPNPQREVERGRSLAQASLAAFGRGWVHFGLARPKERC